MTTPSLLDELVLDARTAAVLSEYELCSGPILDYVFLKAINAFPAESLHRLAAATGMAIIDRRLEQLNNLVADEEFPASSMFRACWDTGKLVGRPVTFREFWGGDTVSSMQIDQRTWTLPKVDGYKTAFFLPPHGPGTADEDWKELFERINTFALGPDPKSAEIYSWSTDWSNYFDAGHEWWGAYYWTIRPSKADYITVVAASATD